MTSILCLPDELIDIVFSLLPLKEALNMTHCCVELYRPHHVHRSAKRIADKMFPNLLDRGLILWGWDIYKILVIESECWDWVYIDFHMTRKYESLEEYTGSDEFRGLEREMQANGYRYNARDSWCDKDKQVTRWSKGCNNVIVWGLSDGVVIRHANRVNSSLLVLNGEFKH